MTSISSSASRGVAIVGDDEGHLLTLEANLVGGEHRLGVVAQRRHPRQLQAVEHGAGDHGLDLWMSLGRGSVDRDDLGVGVGAAQDRPVQHPGQVDVVDVVALAAHETDVFLAQHPPEPDRVPRGRHRHLGRRHDVTASSRA
jgi:hypothetical protein